MRPAASSQRLRFLSSPLSRLTWEGWESRIPELSLTFDPPGNTWGLQAKTYRVRPCPARHWKTENDYFHFQTSQHSLILLRDTPPPLP